MAEHPNAQIMRRANKAFSEGDIAALKEIIAEDAVWHVPGKSALAGDYRGHEEIFGFFGKLMELSGGTFKAELHDITASDKHAVNLDRLTGTRGEKALDINLALVVHIKDGKIKDAWDVFTDLYAWDDFCS
ncbi:MAG: nuclear transport factor 2 family protein [Blastocatellia bacterium]|nr:nuclear transport factor 2 family protein [Blastocatellia bacterium]